MRKFYLHLQFFLITLFSLCSSQITFATDYYWVGHGGAWSNLSHWSNTSGGSGNTFTQLPGPSDRVIFDLNSFVNNSAIVNIDGSYAVADFDCSAAPNIIIQGSSTDSLTIYGSLDLGYVQNQFDGAFHFRGTASHSIQYTNSSIQSDLYIYAGQYTFLSDITSSKHLYLKGGNLDFNGKTIYLKSLACSLSTAAAIDFSDATLYLADNYLPLDLRTSGQSFTTYSNSNSYIHVQTLTNNVVIQSGHTAKRLPHLYFYSSYSTISLKTGAVATSVDRVEFQDIICTGQNNNVYIDGGYNCNVKSFGNIKVNQNSYINIKAPNSVINSTSNTRIEGRLDVGKNSRVWLQTAYMEVKGVSFFGEGLDFYARRPVVFRDSVYFNGSKNAKNTGAHFNTYFHGPVEMSGTNRFNFSYNAFFYDNVRLSKNTEAIFTNNKYAPKLHFDKKLELGPKSRMQVGKANEVVNYEGTDSLVMQSESLLFIHNTNATTYFKDIICTTFNIIELPAGKNVEITGDIQANGSCGNWNWFRSSDIGTATNITLLNNQNTQGLVCEDLAVSGAVFDNVEGTDIANNSGITFSAAQTPKRLYWVGGHLLNDANTKANTPFSTGVNNNWSNPANWSLYADSLTQNACIPTAIDDVHFTTYSFSPSNGDNVNVDIAGIVSCNDMIWTDVMPNSFLDRDSTQTNREFIIYGNLLMDEPNMTNLFESLITFSAKDINMREVGFQGEQAAYSINFDYPGGQWKLKGDIDVNGPLDNSDISINKGTLYVLNAEQISLEDDWFVNQTLGYFSAGTGKVLFDGQTSNTTDQLVNSFNSPFYNFEVNNVTNKRVLLQDSIIVQARLEVLDGHLWDAGYQIIGNSNDTLRVANNAMLTIGHTNKLSLFPSNYLPSKIQLETTSITQYYSTLRQRVSSRPPVYGHLRLSNLSGSHLKEKCLADSIIITGWLHIDNEQNFIDNGYQIYGNPNYNMLLDPGSKLTLGSDTVATLFPTDYELNRIYLYNNSEVIYNAGVAQTVKGLNGSYPHSYYDMTCRDANLSSIPAALIPKTLNANNIIRHDLRIEEYNIHDANPFNYNTNIAGDWFNSGRFEARQAQVLFNGGSLQRIEGDSVSRFYDWALSNAQGLELAQKAEVENQASFINGIVLANNYAYPLRFLENGFVSTVDVADDQSHVNGYVAKASVSTDWFRYPCGDGTQYRPIASKAESTAFVEFQTKYYPQPYVDRTVLSPLHHVSNLEYWELDRVQGSTRAMIELSWNANSFANSNASIYSQLRVAHYQGVDWEDIGGLNHSWNSTMGYLNSNGYWDDFSPFTLGTTIMENLLPLEDLSFEAQTVEQHNSLLTWELEEADKVAHFEVEHSWDGLHFQAFDQVEGMSSLTSYQTMHRNRGQGMHYYRLKIWMKDGLYRYSEIIVLEDLQEVRLELYPNPVVNVLQVQSPDARIEVIHLINSLGQVVFTKSGQESIDLNVLSSGTYQVLIHLENGEQIQRSIIKL